MAALVLSINYHNRAPLQFVKIGSFPFRIGRAYDNDLILADDTVSPHHLQIERDEEGYLVRNLSTENGTRIGDHQLGADPSYIQVPATLEVGHTDIRVMSTDTPVVPTKTKIELTRLSTACMDIRVALALLGFYLFLNITFMWQRQAIFRDWQEILMDELFSLLLPLGLATVTGFVCRLLLHRWRFSLQLSIASLLFIGNLVLPEVMHFVNYLFTNHLLAEVLYEVSFALGLMIILAWQLRSVSGMTRKRSSLTSVAIVLPITGLMNLQEFLNTSEFRRQPAMNTVLTVGDVRIAPTYASIDAYTQELKIALQTNVEKELEEAKERRNKKPKQKDSLNTPDEDPLVAE